MKNTLKKLSALILSTMFFTTQSSLAVIETGLNNAQINNANGGFVGVDTGVNSATLNFNGDSHVNWNTLNVNKGETLNFNAVNGANGLTILNTVNQGMTNVYGTINSNSGISKLIISNPNGVLFDGATFNAAGDVMLTTQPMNATLNNGKLDIKNVATTNSIGVVNIKNSDFSVGGEFNILAPGINLVGGKLKTNKGLKLVTANGQDYIMAGNDVLARKARLEAVNIDGNVYIIADKGVVTTVNGGEIKGNLKIDSNNSVALNYENDGKELHVTGNVDVLGNGARMHAKNVKVDGDLKMENGGGYLEVRDVTVGKNMTLTTNVKSKNGYKHFIHVIGDTNIAGDVKIESANNVHIGGYDYGTQKLINGKFNVGGNLDVHADNGTIAVTVDTTAKNIKLKSDKLNIITDGKAKLSADTYDLSANGYIGGLKQVGEHSPDKQILTVMENYILLNNPTGTTYLNTTGGEIINVSTKSNAYIDASNDMKVTGADVKDLYLGSDKDITIEGPNVKANNIIVDGKTNKLKVDFPSRNYTLKYTNIRDAKEVIVNGNEEITYELTNGENGYNTNTTRPNKTTYLVGPDKPITPNPNPDDNNENVKVLRSFERPVDPNTIQAATPVAYAADLDEDRKDTGIRKNVDGSVTVVRTFTKK